MQAMAPEVAVPGRARVGEGPVWDARDARLHWVDIPAGHIHTSDPTTGQTSTLDLPTHVGAAVPRRGGGFVAAVAEGFASVEAGMTVRCAILPVGERMNDAKCDRRGRLWAGSTTMDFQPGRGALHVLMPDWTTRVVLEGLTLPNGLGWSPDGRTFYLADTMAGEISAFDADLERATIGRRRTFARFPDGTGMPDGLTVDATGCLWVAMWGGDRVVRISPDADVLGELPMPAHQPSSCTFGGTALDVLYITSAREGLDLPDDDPAGSVFAVGGLGVVGTPAAAFAG
ncbi:CBU_1789 family Dot/Icm type IV secretion system effector [Dactylosporangium salmoneum]|uniref:CBU_1789 family Dot/Icm type IV secretion system effector n=2 Tax=Dactylosporangium salmoneum TaxID=53361 RepID=A0ABP5T825_9ACTN